MAAPSRRSSYPLSQTYNHPLRQAPAAQQAQVLPSVASQQVLRRLRISLDRWLLGWESAGVAPACSHPARAHEPSHSMRTR
jgi:hypothetical protein